MKERAVATLTIRGAHDTTPKGRRAVALWLRREAKHLERCGREYAPRFTARYFVR
jgi:hypothetical protein